MLSLKWFGRQWSRPHDCDTVERIYREACIRDRSHDQKSLTVTVDVGVWAQIPVIDAIRTWVRGMDADKFAQGTLTDKFVWTYSVYMIAGFSMIGMKAWINRAVNDTGEWLRTAMCVFSSHYRSGLKSLFVA